MRQTIAHKETSKEYVAQEKCMGKSITLIVLYYNEITARLLLTVPKHNNYCMSNLFVCISDCIDKVPIRNQISNLSISLTA